VTVPSAVGTAARMSDTSTCTLYLLTRSTHEGPVTVRSVEPGGISNGRTKRPYSWAHCIHT